MAQWEWFGQRVLGTVVVGALPARLPRTERAAGCRGAEVGRLGRSAPRSAGRGERLDGTRSVLSMSVVRRLYSLGTMAVLVAAFWLGGVAAVAQGSPKPPAQPLVGPGGALGRYEGVVATRFGEAPRGYWLFKPTEPREDDGDGIGGALPVVVFLHGFTAVNPERYLLWIEHVARRGAIVIYPDYQRATAFGDDWRSFLPNAMEAVRAAMATLEAGGGARADTSRVAVVGHSLGGVLAAGYAASAEAEGLPAADVLVAVEPGGCGGCPPLSAEQGMPLPDLSRVPGATKALMVVGDADQVVGDGAAKTIWRGLTAIPAANRDYVTVVSDDRGSPALRATHLFPQTAGWGSTTDALDWYGTWKLVDLLTDCAFAGRGCDDALGGSARQRTMGVWSDGVPVAELRVTDEPGAPV